MKEIIMDTGDLAEIQKLLNEAQSPAPVVNAKAKTTREWAAIWKCPERQARETLRQLHSRGRIVVSTQRVLQMDGRPKTVPVYEILKTPLQKKKKRDNKKR